MEAFNEELSFAALYDDPAANKPVQNAAEEKSLIRVFGVGGAGNNAVNQMVKMDISGVNYYALNTDKQALANTNIPDNHKLLLGQSGLGAGTKPETACQYAQEQEEQIRALIGEETQMVFVTAGLGKGTGTGASPVVAKIARDMNLLTLAVVSYPYDFEGPRAKQQANAAIDELKKYVDSIIVVQNQRILEEHKKENFMKGYEYANDVLGNAVKCISDMISVHSMQNVDFNDVKVTMEHSGDAMLGIAEAEGDDRISEVVTKAMTSPLIDDANVDKAEACLFFLSASSEFFPTGEEMQKLIEEIRNFIDKDADVIMGMGIDDSLGEKIRIAIVMTKYNKLDNNDFDPLTGHLNISIQPSVVKPEKVEPLVNRQADSFNPLTAPQSVVTVQEQQVVVPQPTAQSQSPAPLQPQPQSYQQPQSIPQSQSQTQSSNTFQPNNTINQASVETPNTSTVLISQKDDGAEPTYDDKDIFNELVSTPAFERINRMQEKSTQLAEPAIPNYPQPNYSNGFLFGQMPSVD